MHLVELATVEDRDWIRALWKQHEGVFGHVFHRYWRLYLRSLEWYGPDCRFVCEVCRPCEGAQFFEIRDDGAIQLRGVAVVSPKRKLGVGHALRQSVLSRQRVVYGMIDASNAQSIRLHEALGFVAGPRGNCAITGKTMIPYVYTPVLAPTPKDALPCAAGEE